MDLDRSEWIEELERRRKEVTDEVEFADGFNGHYDDSTDRAFVEELKSCYLFVRVVSPPFSVLFQAYLERDRLTKQHHDKLLDVLRRRHSRPDHVNPLTKLVADRLAFADPHGTNPGRSLAGHSNSISYS